jgi:hypothetical protein
MANVKQGSRTPKSARQTATAVQPEPQEQVQAVVVDEKRIADEAIAAQLVDSYRQEYMIAVRAKEKMEALKAKIVRIMSAHITDEVKNVRFGNNALLSKSFGKVKVSFPNEKIEADIIAMLPDEAFEEKINWDVVLQNCPKIVEKMTKNGVLVAKPATWMLK